MSWKGFLYESKHFMSYRKGNRLRFWLQFPGAWFRFHRSQFRYWQFWAGRSQKAISHPDHDRTKC